MIPLRDRREILRRSFCDVGITPEELSRLCIDADETFAQQLHILSAPASLDHNRRRITSLIAARYRGFPNQLAGLLVHRCHRGLRAAWRDYHQITINQGRLGIGPVAGFTTEVFTQTLLPANLACLRFETSEIAIGAECVDEVTVDRRSRSCFRIIRFLFRITDVPDSCRPDHFSVDG